MMWKHWLASMTGFIILMSLTGCILVGDEDETPGATPEPAENQVVFTVPYRAVLDQGDTVPGARLQYIGETDDGIHVLIDGEDAYRKVGDSFNWSGSPTGGVELDYRLRVVGVYLDVFQAWGNVGIIVPDANPVVTELPDDDAPLTFHLATIDATVPKGERVPGTTYRYLGKTDKGAEFGGVDGYAYRELADSLDWAGQLRGNVYVDLTMRIRSIQDEEVKLVGTATVWIFP